VIVVYLAAPRTITVNLRGLSNTASASWFDPSNGAYKSISGKEFPNTGFQEFTPPGNNHSGEGDWVLLLKTMDQTQRKAVKRAVK